MRVNGDVSLIDFHDPTTWRARRPLQIAHRGGVVGLGRPENSRAAIRQAAADDYDMVELDITMAQDGELVLFHDVDGTLRGTSAAGKRVHEMMVPEFGDVVYEGSAEPVIRLDEGLELCQALRLSVMLDIKIDLDRVGGRPLVARIGELLAAHRLTGAAMTITAHPLIDDVLAERLLRPIGDVELAQVAAGEQPRFAGHFWFGVPWHLPASLIAPLQGAGALVVPAINTHRYRGGAEDLQARADIRRLMAVDVDGFQIDSVFRDTFVTES